MKSIFIFLILQFAIMLYSQTDYYYFPEQHEDCCGFDTTELTGINIKVRIKRRDKNQENVKIGFCNVNKKDTLWIKDDNVDSGLYCIADTFFLNTDSVKIFVRYKDLSYAAFTHINIFKNQCLINLYLLIKDKKRKRKYFDFVIFYVVDVAQMGSNYDLSFFDKLYLKLQRHSWFPFRSLPFRGSVLTVIPRSYFDFSYHCYPLQQIDKKNSG